MSQLDLFAVVAKEPTRKCVSCGKKATRKCPTYWCRQLCDAPLCGGCEHSPGVGYNHRKAKK